LCAHFGQQRSGRSNGVTGQIPSAPKGLPWVAIEIALHRGKRNLPGGTTLAQLLEKHREVRNRLAVPDLTEAVILSWADQHHTRTGEWPKDQDRAIAAAPGETRHAVDSALMRGTQGLPGGTRWRSYWREAVTSATNPTCRR
jgi:hypothetical protein